MNNGLCLVWTSSRMAVDHHPFFDVFTSACKGADRAREQVRVWQGGENESDASL